MNRRNFIARIVSALAVIPFIGPRLAMAKPAAKMAEKTFWFDPSTEWAWDMLCKTPDLVSCERHRFIRGDGLYETTVSISHRGIVDVDSLTGLMNVFANERPVGLKLISHEVVLSPTLAEMYRLSPGPHRVPSVFRIGPFRSERCRPAEVPCKRELASIRARVIHERVAEVAA